MLNQTEYAALVTEQEIKIEAYRNVKTFLGTIPEPMRRGMVRNILDKPMTLNGANVLKRWQHAKNLFKDGYYVQGDKLMAPDSSFFLKKDITQAVFSYIQFLTGLPRIADK